MRQLVHRSLALDSQQRQKDRLDLECLLRLPLLQHPRRLQLPSRNHQRLRLQRRKISQRRLDSELDLDNKRRVDLQTLRSNLLQRNRLDLARDSDNKHKHNNNQRLRSRLGSEADSLKRRKQRLKRPNKPHSQLDLVHPLDLDNRHRHKQRPRVDLELDLDSSNRRRKIALALDSRRHNSLLRCKRPLQGLVACKVDSNHKLADGDKQRRRLQPRPRRPCRPSALDSPRPRAPLQLLLRALVVVGLKLALVILSLAALLNNNLSSNNNPWAVVASDNARNLAPTLLSLLPSLLVAFPPPSVVASLAKALVADSLETWRQALAGLRKRNKTLAAWAEVTSPALVANSQPKCNYHVHISAQAFHQL